MTVFERLRGYHLALARGKPYEQSLRAFEALVATCKVIPLDPAAAGLAGRIWAALDRSHRAALGHIFIAACAGTQRLRLVTRSRKAQ